MIVYFTGTGNSRFCARMLAQQLGDEVLDSFHFIRDGVAAEVFSEKPWVFVAPTYGWQLPRVFVDFIRSGAFEGSREAYFVMTCGGDIGNAAIANEALCREKGLRSMGTQAVVMPENYIALFDAPGKEEARSIVLAARPALENAVFHIRSGKALPEEAVGLSGKLKSGPVNKIFYRYVIKAKHFRVAGDCVGCGKCEKRCPLGNVRLQNGKPHWGGRCTHCMACICGCPKGAIEYGKASVGKPRYQCPDDPG